MILKNTLTYRHLILLLAVAGCAGLLILRGDNVKSRYAGVIPTPDPATGEGRINHGLAASNGLSVGVGVDARRLVEEERRHNITHGEPITEHPVESHAADEGAESLGVPSVPIELKELYVTYRGEIWPLGAYAQSFLESPTSDNATTLLLHTVALRMELAGTALLPEPGHPPGSLEEAKAFPPPLPGQMAVSTNGRRCYFYPDEFPLYANAVGRRQEELADSGAVVWTPAEVSQIIAFAAEAAALAQQ